jgi:hypothetical protein
LSGGCDRIRIGRGRDNRAPTQVAAWQGRPPAPLPRDESRLQSGRDQAGTQLEARKQRETHTCAHACSVRPSGAVTRTLAKRRSEWGSAANAKALLWPVLPKVSVSPAVSRSTLHIGDAAVRNCSGIQSGARPALNCAESSAYGTTRSRRGSRWRSHNSGATSQRASAWAAQPLVLNARPNASAQPSTRTTHWIPMLQRAANTGPRPSSACPFSAGPWRRRSTMAPLDSQPAATILQTESSRRSTTTDEKHHPRPHRRVAA